MGGLDLSIKQQFGMPPRAYHALRLMEHFGHTWILPRPAASGSAICDAYLVDREGKSVSGFSRTTYEYLEGRALIYPQGGIGYITKTGRDAIKR